MDTFTTHFRGGYKILDVSTKKASFKGIPWAQLGGFGKKKFDNWIFLNNVKNQGSTRTKIIYT